MAEEVMRPDTYIKFDGDEYFRAVRGHTAHVQIGYLKAIWHYRSHNHCKGLENNSEFLRRICEIDLEHWDETFEVIFDNNHFFSMDENGLWHQKRAEQDWIEDSLAYQRRVQISTEANKQRWKKKRK